MLVQVENRKMMAFWKEKFQQGDDPLYERKIYEKLFASAKGNSIFEITIYIVLVVEINVVSLYVDA